MTDFSSAQIISNANSWRSQYDLTFQVSPIFLQGGIAANVQGQILPIIALYGQLSLYQQLTSTTSAAATTDPNQFFARYVPLPGSTLISNAIGSYPFANQQVAANAIIAQPLTLSMLMIAPVNQPGGYVSKLATFTALKASLQNHNNAGGTYAVATPANVYGPLIMTNMSDVTRGESQQQQIEYQIDFVEPLLTTFQAAAAMGSLMTKVTNGTPFTGNPSWSGNEQAQIAATTQALTGALTQFGSPPSQQGNIVQP